MESKDTQHQPKKHMTLISIDGFEQLQIFACSQALDMASKHNLFVTRPANIRGTALHWLAKVGNPQKPKASWKTLAREFELTFGEILAQKKERKGATE